MLNLVFAYCFKLTADRCFHETRATGRPPLRKPGIRELTSRVRIDSRFSLFASRFKLIAVRYV